MKDLLPSSPVLFPEAYLLLWLYCLMIRIWANCLYMYVQNSRTFLDTHYIFLDTLYWVSQNYSLESLSLRTACWMWNSKNSTICILWWSYLWPILCSLRTCVGSFNLLAAIWELIFIINSLSLNLFLSVDQFSLSISPAKTFIFEHIPCLQTERSLINLYTVIQCAPLRHRTGDCKVKAIT